MLHTSETGVLRFDEIRRLMTDCSQKMLSQTLKSLEQFLLIAALHELPDVCQQSLFRLWQTALHMKQIGSVFIHEDGVESIHKT